MIDSRIPGFYRLPLHERRVLLQERLGLTADEVCALDGGLDAAAADHVIENVIGTYGLPLGLVLNVRVNERDYLVPMCVEEPSVVAAASNGARMAREGGGFRADADPPVMIAQVQLLDVPDVQTATRRVREQAAEILAAADRTQPDLLAHGGGCRGLEVRDVGEMLVVHLKVDCRDAMGANMVNTMVEAVAPLLAELSGGRPLLRILSNLADQRKVRVRARVPLAALAPDGDGGAVRDAIVVASRFAGLDPYRAATHNKGIMNGVDPVVIATGNDWRSVEAGAHAFAARSGAYRPLAVWHAADAAPDADLVGQLEMPMALGIVGGTLRGHPGARLALRILGVTTAAELGMVVAAVGLASNLAALRALASEGIQRGHMRLHARSVALSAGATGGEVERVATAMIAARDVSPVRAAAELARVRAG
ncbi:MAG: hydroxymethylglutaryl-CoA reductase, degradative [Deltaproteobacteria bacterium]|nr:hydroxymethylglutaryl-CoA reductase, degradative [Deltaproteobacteria bacterium]